MKRSLLRTAAAAALAIGAGQAAHATPYAFAGLTYDNFSISETGGVTFMGGSVSVNTAQSYPGSPDQSGSPPTYNFPGTSYSPTAAITSIIYGGPNATYGTSPPSPVGSTTPAPIQESALRGGDGAQAAVSVGASNPFTTGDGSIQAVENGGVSPPGNLSATAVETENVFTFQTPSTCGPSSVCTVSFKASVQEYVDALIQNLGEYATASTAGTLTLVSCSAFNGSGQCTSYNNVVQTVNAIGINATVSYPLGSGENKEFAPGASTKNGFVPVAVTLTLAPGTDYELALDSKVSETTSTIAVPEPASLTVLGTALLGLGAVVRRRRKS